MEKYFTLDEALVINDYFYTHHGDENLRSDVSLNESAQINVAAGAVDKMLDFTIARYSKIDFMDIERSRGDVVECKMYKNLKESIDILCDIDAETHNVPGAHVVSDALNNLFTLKSEFVNAFRMKNNYAILLYNTIYYSVIEATAYLIAASIDYVVDGKKPQPKAYKVNCRDQILLDNLTRFNTMVADGTVSKFITEGEKISNADTSAINEAALPIVTDLFTKFVTKFGDKIGSVVKSKAFIIGASIAAFIYLCIKIIPIIQSCIYAIFKTRHKISESSKMQAELINMNAEMAENDGADASVIEKQKNTANKFRKLANAFALESDKANRDATQELTKDQVNVNVIYF